MPYPYFLEVSLCWTIFYGFYYALLRHETFFNWNRAYLMLTLVAGLLLPLFEIGTVLPIIPEAILLPEIVVGDGKNIAVANTDNSTFYNFNWLMLLYFAGGCLAFLQISLALKRIIFFVKTGEHETYSEYELINLSTITAPFSFDRWLFLNKNLIDNETELQQILQHEQAHIQQRHSWDILLFEVIRIAFWWCPLLYLYKRSLRSVHEYLADAAVLQTANRKAYGRFLLQHLQPLPTYSIVNHFHSQIKLRIVMLTKTPSSSKKQLKYLLFIPLFFAVAFFTACEKEAIEYDAGKIQQQFTQLAEANDGEINAAIEADLARMKEIHPNHTADLQSIFDRAFDVSDAEFDNSVVYKKVDKMPMFAGCEDRLEDERKDCSDKELLMFIYSNIKYPQQARDAGIEGMVVLNFIVDAAGRTHYPKIVNTTINSAQEATTIAYQETNKSESIAQSAAAKSLEEAVLSVYHKMKQEHIWVPGQKDGEAVSVSFNLPVKFKLQ
ncbi:MAG: M56 family metallopeptidase [Saprospiraceae bacterium]